MRFQGGWAGGREENCPKRYFSWGTPRQSNFESENFIIENCCCHEVLVCHFCSLKLIRKERTWAIAVRRGSYKSLFLLKSGCDRSGHLQIGKRARSKNPGKMGKKMENGPKPKMAEGKNGQNQTKIPFSGPFFHFNCLSFGHLGLGAIFHFLSHFSGILAPGPFPIL